MSYYLNDYFKRMISRKITMCRTSVSRNQWQTLEGKVLLETLPDRKIGFYLEGPSPGVDLLIDYVLMASTSRTNERAVSILSQAFLLRIVPNTYNRTKNKSSKGKNI